jgi:hypothetical protein
MLPPPPFHFYSRLRSAPTLLFLFWFFLLFAGVLQSYQQFWPIFLRVVTFNSSMPAAAILLVVFLL